MSGRRSSLRRALYPPLALAALFSDRTFAPLRLRPPLSGGLGSQRRCVGRVTGPPCDALPPVVRQLASPDSRQRTMGPIASALSLSMVSNNKR